MEHVSQLTAFLAAAFGIAFSNWLIPARRSVAIWSAFGLGLTVLATPLLIAPQHVMLRALACVLAIDLFFKIIDYAVQRQQGSPEYQDFVSYAKFLVPFPVLLVRITQRAQRSRFDFSAWCSTTFFLLVFALCVISLDWFSQVQILRSSFLLDHTVKFGMFTLAIESLSRFIHGLEQFVGYETVPLVDSAFLSQTVGEFWYRFNTRVHSWLDYNIFRPLGGLRSPVRGVFLTFFVSAVLHEVGFAIATSRWDGYQFAFFLIQAPAVVFGRFVYPVVKTNSFAKIALRVATIVWMWATSILFFHGVNRVFPFFYVSTPWLP